MGMVATLAMIVMETISEIPVQIVLALKKLPVQTVPEVAFYLVISAKVMESILYGIDLCPPRHGEGVFMLTQRRQPNLTGRKIGNYPNFEVKYK